MTTIEALIADPVPVMEARRAEYMNLPSGFGYPVFAGWLKGMLELVSAECRRARLECRRARQERDDARQDVLRLMDERG